MSIQKQIADIDAKIATLTAKRAELQAEADKQFDVNKLKGGEVLVFNYGRGEKVAQKEGVVLGFKAPPKQAAIIRVQIGTGVDAEIVTVFPSQVLAVKDAAAA